MDLDLRKFSTGVYLVTENSVSKIADLKEKNTVAHACLHNLLMDDLCQFIKKTDNRRISDTLELVEGGGFCYNLGTNYDFCNELFEFISLDKEGRKAKLKELKGYNLNSFTNNSSINSSKNWLQLKDDKGDLIAEVIDGRFRIFSDINLEALRKNKQELLDRLKMIEKIEAINE